MLRFERNRSSTERVSSIEAKPEYKVVIERMRRIKAELAMIRPRTVERIIACRPSS